MTSRKKKEEKEYVSLFRFPEIKFGIEWEFDSPKDFVKDQIVDGKEPEPSDNVDQGRPLKNSIGFTIPKANMGYHTNKPAAVVGNEKMRGAFPALTRYADVTFMDNVDATQIHSYAMSAMQESMIAAYAQPDGGYPLSKASARVVRRTHDFEKNQMGVADSQGEVILASSVSELMHRLAIMYYESWNGEGEVIVSEACAESARGPWSRLRDRGIEVKDWEMSDALDPVPLEGLGGILSSSTNIVVLSHANPVLGEVCDLEALVKFVKEKAPDAKVVVEGSVFAQHRAMDVVSWGVDWYTYNTHQCFGASLGVLYGEKNALSSLKGPGFSHLADSDTTKFELGPVSVEACAARCAFEQYMAMVCGEVGVSCEDDTVSHANLVEAWDALEKRFEAPLVDKLLKFLNSVEEVRIHGRHGTEGVDCVGVVSFTHDTISNSDIWAALNNAKITSSAGHANMPELCKALGLKSETGSQDSGVVRLSVVHYNVPDEVDWVVQTLSALFKPGDVEGQ